MNVYITYTYEYINIYIYSRGTRNVVTWMRGHPGALPRASTDGLQNGTIYIYVLF